jgi:hypothetical protein
MKFGKRLLEILIFFEEDAGRCCSHRAVSPCGLRVAPPERLDPRPPHYGVAGTARRLQSFTAESVARVASGATSVSLSA